jgi:hypothetical protein
MRPFAISRCFDRGNRHSFCIALPNISAMLPFPCLQALRLAVYRRLALGIAFCRKGDFAALMAAFSIKSFSRRVNESMTLVSSAMLKAFPDGDLRKAVPPLVERAPAGKSEYLIRKDFMEFQLWYLMAADMRDEFPLLRSAYQTFVNDRALKVGRFMGLEWTEGRPVVHDLLVNGHGRKATLIHPEEVARIYKLLCLTQHVPDRCHVSQTNIEAVINAITARRSQAEWFLLVVVVGEVSSLSLASLVMAFSGSSGRLLLVYSTAVMEGLRVANRLSDVHLSPMVVKAEEFHVQWNVVEGFGSAAASELTGCVSAGWRGLVNDEVQPAWRRHLERIAKLEWTSRVG